MDTALLVRLLIAIVVVLVALYILERYVASRLPADVGRIVLIVGGLLAIVVLLVAAGLFPS